jgi:hypothetical protein
MRLFRHAAVFRVYTMFALAVLALHASRDLTAAADCERRAAWRRLPVVGGLTAVSALSALAWVESSVRGVTEGASLAHLHFAIAWLGTVGAALVGLRAGTHARKVLFPWLAVGLAIADGLLAAHIDRWTMYLPRDRWREIERSQVHSLDLTSHPQARVPFLLFDGMLDNKNFPLRLPVLRSYSALENSFHRQWVEREFLVRSAIGRERTWFSASVATVPATQEAFEAFMARAAVLGSPPLVVSSRASMLGKTAARQDLSPIASLPPARAVPAVVEEYRPTTLSLTVTCPERGWLWVTDRWARGWRAAVNGDSVEVSGGNFIFRAVPVEAGVNRVVFEYRPFGYPGLLILSWSTMALVALVTLRHHLGRRRTGSP